MYLDTVFHFLSEAGVCSIQSDGSDVLRMSFNTPGSRVDRELRTELQLNRQQQRVRLDVKTPWKTVNVRGSLVNEASVKKALLSATLDETTEYSVDAELQVTLYLLSVVAITRRRAAALRHNVLYSLQVSGALTLLVGRNCRKSIHPVKKLSDGYWRGYLSGVWCK